MYCAYTVLNVLWIMIKNWKIAVAFRAPFSPEQYMNFSKKVEPLLLSYGFIALQFFYNCYIPLFVLTL